MVADLAQGRAVAAALGLPLAALILWLMAHGTVWWLWAWAAWIAFKFLVLALYPTVIAPLFNKFEPLPEAPARAASGADRALRLRDKGLFVMDGSRRSATATPISPASAAPSASSSSTRC